MKRGISRADRLKRLQEVIAAAMGEVDRLYGIEADGEGDDLPQFDVDAAMTVVLGERLAKHAAGASNNRSIAIATATLRRAYELVRRQQRAETAPVDLAMVPSAGRA